MCWPLGHEGRANAITSRLIASRHPPTLQESIDGCRGFSCFFSGRRYTPSARSLPFSPTLGRVTEKEWLREMRKQIEFSKTIARRGGAAAMDVTVVVGGGARHLQVQGRFTSGGQVPELIVRKGDGENTREKIKGRRGREIRAARRGKTGGRPWGANKRRRRRKRIVAPPLVPLIRSFIRAITRCNLATSTATLELGVNWYSKCNGRAGRVGDVPRAAFPIPEVHLRGRVKFTLLP